MTVLSSCMDPGNPGCNPGKVVTTILPQYHLKQNPKPVYLGVTLDRTLNYREHLTKTVGKNLVTTCSRNSLAHYIGIEEQINAGTMY